MLASGNKTMRTMPNNCITDFP